MYCSLSFWVTNIIRYRCSGSIQSRIKFQKCSTLSGFSWNEKIKGGLSDFGFILGLLALHFSFELRAQLCLPLQVGDLVVLTCIQDPFLFAFCKL